jgi:hypothetical protein
MPSCHGRASQQPAVSFREFGAWNLDANTVYQVDQKHEYNICGDPSIENRPAAFPISVTLQAVIIVKRLLVWGIS